MQRRQPRNLVTAGEMGAQGARGGFAWARCPAVCLGLQVPSSPCPGCLCGAVPCPSTPLSPGEGGCGARARGRSGTPVPLSPALAPRELCAMVSPGSARTFGFAQEHFGSLAKHTWRIWGCCSFYPLLRWFLLLLSHSETSRVIGIMRTAAGSSNRS